MRHHQSHFLCLHQHYSHLSLKILLLLLYLAIWIPKRINCDKLKVGAICLLEKHVLSTHSALGWPFEPVFLSICCSVLAVWLSSTDQQQCWPCKAQTSLSDSSGPFYPPWHEQLQWCLRVKHSSSDGKLIRAARPTVLNL